MPDGDYRVQPVTFERGVNESVEPSMLPSGAATRIRNWVPDPSGNLRVRIPWSKASTTSAPAAPRKVKGIAAYTKTTRPTMVQKNYTTVTGTTLNVGASVSWNRNTTFGNLLVMRVAAGYTTDLQPLTVTVSAGWTPAVTKNSDATQPGQFVGIYFIQNNAGSVAAPSVSVSGKAGSTMRVFVEISEWANMSQTAVYSTGGPGEDPYITSSNSGITSAVTWADPLINADSDNPDSRLDMAVAFVSTSGNFTPGSSPNNFKEQHDDKTGGVGTVGMFYRITTDKRLAFNQEISTAAPWVTAAVCFQGVDYAEETQYIVAANALDNYTYKFYAAPRATISSGSWKLIDTCDLADINATTNTPVAFASGLGSLFYSTQNFVNIKRWNDISTDTNLRVLYFSPPGRALAFHKNRLWSGGSTFAPTRLFYSEINDADDWTATAGLNYIDISTDDGEPIEDLVSFGDYLLIGKRNSLWLLSGSSEEDFVLSKLPAGGCAPGRSMVATPYGAVVAGKNAVWLVGSEGSAEMLSRAISKSYAFTGKFMSTSFVNDVASICDEGTGTIWSINMNTGVWSEERVDSTTECPAVITQDDDLQLFGPKQATLGSLVSYRTPVTGTRAKDFDTLTETFEAITPELWPVGSTVKITPRHLYVRVRQRGGNADQTGLTITPYYEGWEGTAQTFGPEDAAGVYRYRFDLGERRGINYAQFKFSQTVPSGQASLVDIEEVEFGFNVEQVR